MSNQIVTSIVKPSKNAPSVLNLLELKSRGMYTRKRVHVKYPVFRFFEPPPDNEYSKASYVGMRANYVPHLNRGYCNQVFKSKNFDDLISYIYLVYKDLDYFLDIEYKGPRDPLFDRMFGYCGAIKYDDAKEFFIANYDEFLVHSLMKLRRASLPVYDKETSCITTFITNALPKIMLTKFIDERRSSMYTPALMQASIDYYEDVDWIESTSSEFHPAMDILLKLAKLDC